MLKFAFNTLGVGLCGNENVYFATIIRYNDFISSLVIIKENTLFSDITNTVIGDVKDMWEGSNNLDSFLKKVNVYSKYRIMPFSISYVSRNDKISIDDLAVEAKNRCLKFFKEADIFIKDTNAKARAEKKDKADKKEKADKKAKIANLLSIKD